MKNKIGRILLILLFAFFVSLSRIESVFAASTKIKLTNISIVEKSSDVDASIVSKADNVVNTNVTYHKLNSYVVYKLTFTNVDKVDYSIKSFEDIGSSKYLYYESDYVKDRIIRSGESIDIEVKETYYNEVDDLSKRTGLSSVKFRFNLIDQSGDESSEDVVINPITGDKIFLYMIILAAALTIVLILLILRSKKKKKDKTTTTLVILLLLLLTPIIAKATEIEVDVTIKNAVKLYDKLKVTYTVNGNTNIGSVKYEETINTPRTPVRNGYTFEGWFEGASLYNFSSPVTEDTDLEARYIEDTYSITYNLDGGETDNPNTFKKEDLPFILNAPTKEGFKFVGWTGSNGSYPEKEVKIIDDYQDLSYTAVWEAEEYNIYYSGLTNEERESLHNPDTYIKTDIITLNNPNNRKDEFGEDSEIFAGWKDEVGNVSTEVTIKNSMGDIEYEAIWESVDPEEYNISYNLHGGTVEGTNPLTYTKQDPDITLINPTKTGYVFLGWIGSNGNTPELEVTIPHGTTGALNYEAIFEVIDYPIAYNLDGGTAVNPETYTVEDTITLVNPTKRGYTFTGWNGTDIADHTMNVTIPVNSIGARTYTATYEVNEYHLYYTLNGGTATNPETYTVEDTFTLNNPTKTGYTFLGWTGACGETPILNVTISNEIEDKTYIANYNAGNYYIHFDKNDSDATGTMSDEEMTVDEASKLTKNTFSKTGYSFDGWTTNPDGTGTHYDDEEMVTNLVTTGTITLYAKWKKVNISVLISGSDFNVRMKSLAHDSGPRTSTFNYSIHKVKFSTNVPQEIIGEGAYRISISSRSDVATYMWYDSDEHTIYYGGDADIIYLNEDASFMYANMANVTEIDNHYDTSNTTKMEQMYYRCRSLVSNNGLTDFNTSNVINMKNLFGECYEMESYNIKNWDVDNVQIFEFMFNQNYKVQSLDLTGWTTKSATNMKNMFSSMYILTDLKIGTFDTSKVTTMANMFDNERAMVSLDVSHLNTSQVTNMTKMFYNMYALQSLNVSTFDTSKVTTMEKMFIGTNTIQTLDLSSFNTARVNNFKNMFDDMTALQTIYVSDNFVTSACTSNPQLFSGDVSLVGGAGTTFNSSQNKLNYAHIDGGTSNPGYFTRK